MMNIRRTPWTSPLLVRPVRLVRRDPVDSRLPSTALGASIVTCVFNPSSEGKAMLDSPEGAQAPSVLSYHSRHFNHVSYVLENALWAFLTRPDNIVRMETTASLDRAALEPLSDPLIAEFGIEIDQREVKQVIGHMVRQIMESLGYEAERTLRITRPGLFTSGLAFRRVGTSRDRSVPVTNEERRARLGIVQGDAFGAWFDKQVRTAAGTVDLDRLAELVCKWNIEFPWKRCRNPGQLIVAARILLRKGMPASEYESETAEVHHGMTGQ
jgi:hypothetical protein